MKILTRTLEEAWRIMEQQVNACLRAGGIPIFKTRYGTLPLKIDDRPAVLIYCYAPLRPWERPPPIDLASLDPRWLEEWEKIDETYGYWRDVYGREHEKLFEQLEKRRLVHVITVRT